MNNYYLLFLFFLCGHSLKAQMTAEIYCYYSSDCEEVCPNEVKQYAFYTNYGGYTITNEAWVVEGGVIIEGGEENDITCKVRWNDEATGKLTIPKITASTSSGTSAVVTNTTMDVQIHSLNGESSNGISGIWEVEFSSSSPITYSALEITDHAGLEVSEYLWNIPVGWSVGGVVSTGTNEYTTTSRSITVTPDECSGGDIKVWGENNHCGTQFIPSDKARRTVSRILPELTIDGPSVLCGSESYQIDIPSGFDIVWDATSNITRVSSQGANPCTFSSSSVDEGYIKATLVKSSCNASVDLPDKLVRLNGPSFDDIYLDVLSSGGQDASVLCSNTTYHIYVMNDGACATSSYTWSVPSAWTQYYTWSNMISINTNSSPGGMVEVFANTCCGTNQKIKIDYLYGGYCGGYYMTMYPNPADSYIELNFTELQEEPEATLAKTSITKESKSEKIIKKNEFGELGNYMIEILDKNGNVWKKVDSSSLNERIEIRDIKPGTYFVHIITEKEVYKRQLVIE